MGIGMIDMIRTVFTGNAVTNINRPYNAHHRIISFHDCSIFDDHTADREAHEAIRNKAMPVACPMAVEKISV
jgi:hypothetical protein